MKKKSINNARLMILTQNGSELTEHNCLTGIMSKNASGFRFEEAIRKGRVPLNPKLYEGQFVSMVKRKNGRYQCYLKAFNPQGLDRSSTAFAIYSEVIEALSIIE